MSSSPHVEEDARHHPSASSVLEVTDHRPPGFNWLTLKRIQWSDPSGRRRVWESAERTTRRGAVDGVAVVARLVSARRPDRVVVISQYRPPLGALCLELPAGLVDAGESAQAAALRELLEETGYSGRVAFTSGVSFSDPGMTNANMQVVEVEVDADSPANANAKQRLDDGECITVHVLPWGGLLDALQARALPGTEALQRELSAELDARLLSFALGLEARGSAAPRRSDGDHTRRRGLLAAAVGVAATVALGAALRLLHSARRRMRSPAAGRPAEA